MTDEELQGFVDQEVRLNYRGRSLAGKLISGFAAQASVKAPYAIEWSVGDPSLGNYEVRRAGIVSAQAVDSVEFINEPEHVGAEINDVANEEQTPG
jgi:hypothetical protein